MCDPITVSASVQTEIDTFEKYIPGKLITILQASINHFRSCSKEHVILTDELRSTVFTERRVVLSHAASNIQALQDQVQQELVDAAVMMQQVQEEENLPSDIFLTAELQDIIQQHEHHLANERHKNARLQQQVQDIIQQHDQQLAEARRAHVLLQQQVSSLQEEASAIHG